MFVYLFLLHCTLCGGTILSELFHSGFFQKPGRFLSPSVVLVLISQYGFLHPRSGVNSGLAPAPRQLGFPGPYRLLRLIHFGPALEGRVSALLFHTRLLSMCQTDPASASQCSGISSLLCGPTQHPISLGTPIRLHSFPHTSFTFLLDFRGQGLSFPSLQSSYLF